MKKTKNKYERGVTLIALIITIIVILILVGTTVTVSLNGKLFKTAKEAADKTQIEAEKEQLLSATLAIYNEVNGGIDFSKLDKNLLEGWTGTNGHYTSPKGNIYTVSLDGSVYEGKGIPVTLPEGLVEGSEFTMDADQDGTEETWIVLYKENDYIEVISKNVMGSVALGKTDPVAVENSTDIDGDGNVTDIDKAIYSFEHSVETLNNYCESLIKIRSIGVRSVGSNPSNPSFVNKEHTEDLDVSHLSEWTDEGKQGWNKYKVLAGTADNNYTTDCNKMKTLGIEVAQNSIGANSNYWIASRNFREFWNDSLSKGYGGFIVKNMNSGGYLDNSYLWDINSTGRVNIGSFSRGIRPVIKFQYTQF